MPTYLPTNRSGSRVHTNPTLKIWEGPKCQTDRDKIHLRSAYPRLPALCQIFPFQAQCTVPCVRAVWTPFLRHLTTDVRGNSFVSKRGYSPAAFCLFVLCVTESTCIVRCLQELLCSGARGYVHIDGFTSSERTDTQQNSLILTLSLHGTWTAV